MKNFVIVLLLSSIIFSQNRVNLREYCPIDQFIEPKVYVFYDEEDFNDTNGNGMYDEGEEFNFTFEKYHAVPLERRDTLLITEVYSPNAEHPYITHEIFTTNQFKFINEKVGGINIKMKGNNKITHQQVIGKEKKYKTAVSFAMQKKEDIIDFSFTVTDIGFEIIGDEYFETITIEYKQDSDLFKETITTYNTLAKGIGKIQSFGKDRKKYLYQILTDQEFEALKCQ